MIRYTPRQEAFSKLPTNRHELKDAARFRNFVDKNGDSLPALLPWGGGASGMSERWDNFDSDRTGTGVFTAFANGMVAATRAEATQGARGGVADFTSENVWAMYAGYTHSHGLAAPMHSPPVKVADALEYWRTEGLGDSAGNTRRICGAMTLRRGDMDDLTLGLAMFGWVGIGLDVYLRGVVDYGDADIYAASFGAKGKPSPVWDNSYRGRHVGRVFVPVIGQDLDGNLRVVLWGKVQRVSLDYYRKHSDEAWVVVQPSALDGTKPIPGFKSKAFATMLERRFGPDAVPPVRLGHSTGGVVTARLAGSIGCLCGNGDAKDADGCIGTATPADPEQLELGFPDDWKTVEPQLVSED
jgi:hypothetical protein